MRTAGESGFLPSRLPNRLPAASSRTERPASFIYETTLSFAARSSSVKDSRVTPPPSCLPISPRSEILRHSRSPSITFVSPPDRLHRSSIPTCAVGAGLVERAEQQVRREPVRRDTVPPGYGAGRKQRVQDRLLRRLRRGVEERGHTLVRDHGEGDRGRKLREAGSGDAAVARGEGEED